MSERLQPPQENKAWPKPSTKGYATPSVFYAEERDRYRDQAEAMKVDPVTGLKNRHAFDEDLPRAFGRGGLGVIYVDLNGLNRVNALDDKHAAGDLYLKTVADTIKTGLRYGEEAYRAGDKSDEIVVLVPGTNPDSISGMINRLTEESDSAIAKLKFPLETFPGVSVGGAIEREDDTAESLLKRADAHCSATKDLIYDGILAEYGIELRRY